MRFTEKLLRKKQDFKLTEDDVTILVGELKHEEGMIIEGAKGNIETSFDSGYLVGAYGMLVYAVGLIVIFKKVK